MLKLARLVLEEGNRLDDRLGACRKESRIYKRGCVVGVRSELGDRLAISRG